MDAVVFDGVILGRNAFTSFGVRHDETLRNDRERIEELGRREHGEGFAPQIRNLGEGPKG